MGRLLNGKTYPCVEFVEAGLISLGVSLFSLSEKTKEGDATAVELSSPEH